MEFSVETGNNKKIAGERTEILRVGCIFTPITSVCTTEDGNGPIESGKLKGAD